MTAPQEIVLEALGEGWIAEFAISTKSLGGRKSGYPTCYKADIANPTLRIAIELDGSRYGRESIDAKKDYCLRRLGWVVYRFNNLYAVQNLDALVARFKVPSVADCPILATVESVESTETNEYYVYDISVEDCHNFYANGVLVHNCQDLNATQIEFVLRSINPGIGRVVAVGDRFQSLYGFRGADTDAIPNIIRALDATVLPLSITYRCPLSHVKRAQQLVSQLEPRSDAPMGVMEDITESKAVSMVQPGDMLICRVNAPLVPLAFDLIRKGIKATVRGRDIGKGLRLMVDKFSAGNDDDLVALETNLLEWREREVARLFRQEKMGQLQQLEDKVDTLLAIMAECSTVSGVKGKIDTLFSDENVGVVLSSVHRAKGLEAERVFILQPHLMPHPRATQAWQMQQEQNCLYVALTRSKRELYFVE